MNKSFVFEGYDTNITYYANNGPTLLVIEPSVSDETIAPIMLEVLNNFKAYFKEINDTDCEEKYMKKRFHYSSCCYLEKIEILNKYNDVVKTILPGSIFTPFIDKD